MALQVGNAVCVLGVAFEEMYYEVYAFDLIAWV